MCRLAQSATRAETLQLRNNGVMAEASGPVQALVSEVVSNEGQLAPTLRAVFENENGDIRPSEFMEALDAYKKRESGCRDFSPKRRVSPMMRRLSWHRPD